MIKALIWNIKPVMSLKAFKWVQMLHNFRKFDFVTLVEPFQHLRYINKYSKRLKMQRVVYNKNEKIWVFINHGFDLSVMSSSDQQLTLLLQNQVEGYKLHVTIVYAKFDVHQRLILWEEINTIATRMENP